MALKLGELVAILKTDNSQFEQGLDKAKGKFKGFADRLGPMAAAGGAAAAVALAAGLTSALDLGQAQAKLTAQMGLTAEESQRFGKIAGNLYKEGFGQSMAELSQTVRAVIQGGLIDRNAATADIEAVARSAQTLADTFDLDVVQAARAAGQMVETGLAKNGTVAMDILTAAMRTTGDQAGDLLDSFSEYAVQFKALGLSGAQGMGLMAQATKAGARDLDVVADSLKEFAIRSKDGSKEAAASFKALGFDAEKMQAIFAKGGPGAAAALDQVLDAIRRTGGQSNAAAIQFGLFGTKSEDLQKALLAMDPSAAVTALGKVEGSTKAAGDALGDTAAGRLEKFKRAVQTALVEKVGEALPTLEKVGKWASDNSGTLLTLAGVLGTVAATVWAVNAATKAWAAAQLIAKGATVAWTAVQWLLNAAMYANPIGLIVLAIVALVAGIWLLWENSAAFRDFWIMVWDAIWGAMVAVGRWFRDTLWPWMKDVWSKISGAAGKAKDWIVDKWDAMIGFFKGLPGKLRRAAAGLWDGIKNSFKSALNWIIGKWNGLSFRIPGLSVPGLGKVWGGATLSTPNLPYLAKGGNITQAGMAMVGERGMEAVYLPAGAQVRPLNGTPPPGYGGQQQVTVKGEIVVRGDGILTGLRDRIAIGGGNVQAVLGSNY